MSDISKIKLNGTEYTLKDPVARGEETETEGISHLTVDGVSYDCKDIVARGEGEPNAREISKVEVNGKTYQIKDEVARGGEVSYDYYFAVYSADDGSLTFYGDNSIPDAGTQYGGKTATTVYEGVENTGDSNPPWYSDRSLFKSVLFDKSFSGARPISCYRWFYNFSNCTAIDGMEYFDTSSVTDMDSIFRECSSFTTLDVSNFDTSSVTNMRQVFRDCSELTTIYSDDAMFVTTAVEDGSQMFRSCEKLVGGNGTVYDSSNYDYDMAHVDRPDNPGYFTDVADK